MVVVSMKQLVFSILIPVYKGSSYLRDALQSIFEQDFQPLEIIICDDNNLADRNEIEKTMEIISSFTSKQLQDQGKIGVTNEVTLREADCGFLAEPRRREGIVSDRIYFASESKIKYFKNKTNLGSQGNIKKLASLAKGDVLYYLCQDDILLKNALQNTHDAFINNKNIGAVTRPFYWFEEDVTKPIRAIFPPDRQKDTALSIFDGEQTIKYIFASVGQISGLAYRKNFIETPFHLDIFPGHVYPFAGILKRHNCVFLKDFTVAVRIKSSQSRTISSIYSTSPLESWVNMFNTVYKNNKKRKVGGMAESTFLDESDVKKLGIKHIATHYEGLVQIKNFGPRGALLREIKNHVKYYWPSIFHPKFWFYAFITLLLPRKLLLFISDNYKRYILASTIKSKNVSC